MSLLNAGKNKKDKKKSGPVAKATFPAPKGKFNTKGPAKTTRFTGGANRGT